MMSNVSAATGVCVQILCGFPLESTSGPSAVSWCSCRPPPLLMIAAEVTNCILGDVLIQGNHCDALLLLGVKLFLNQ